MEIFSFLMTEPNPYLNPLSTKSTKWSNTVELFIRRQQPTNCSSVFDHFVELPVKRLRPRQTCQTFCQTFYQNV